MSCSVRPPSSPSLSEGGWGAGVLRGFRFVLLELKTYTWQREKKKKKKNSPVHNTPEVAPSLPANMKTVLRSRCVASISEIQSGLIITPPLAGPLKEKRRQEGKYLQERERKSLTAPVAAPRGRLAPCTHKLSLTDPPKAACKKKQNKKTTDTGVQPSGPCGNTAGNHQH